jgi:hypothetical protein
MQIQTTLENNLQTIEKDQSIIAQLTHENELLKMELSANKRTMRILFVMSAVSLTCLVGELL